MAVLYGVVLVDMSEAGCSCRRGSQMCMWCGRLGGRRGKERWGSSSRLFADAATEVAGSCS